MSYINLHTHSEYSNMTLKDSTNRLPLMIQYTANPLKQKGFAIASIVSSLIMLSLEMFLLQAMNWVVVGLSGIIAVVVIALITYILNAVIFSAIKQEQQKGKSLATSVEDGYNKNIWVVLET